MTQQGVAAVLRLFKFSNLEVVYDETTNSITGKLGRKKIDGIIQYDWMSERTNNLGIEYTTLEKNTNKLLIYVIMDMGYSTIWITTLKKLKEFVGAKKPWKILPKKDNVDISIYLYRSDLILDAIFTRIDNLGEDSLKKTIKALL